MSQPPPARSATAADVLRWIATHNPFYAISAALVLWGLWASFGNRGTAIETWLLMGSLAGYTVLLAGTAFVLVHCLKLWDDTRTLLLLVVLLLLATSVSFDHVLVVEPGRGTACYLLGLALAVAISEALLRGLRLGLPLLYRLPYYLILALFFLYPLFVRPLLDLGDPFREPFLWALFGFSTAAGLAYLTLLPALRRGPEYVRDNGSPWPWPLYPWSLFVVLAIAVPGRALFMCWSLHAQESINFDRLVFGPYFLVPFGLALAVLLLEAGLVLPRGGLVWTALAAPLLLVLLASIGHNPSDLLYRELRVMTVSIGKYRAFDPVRLTPDPIYAKFLEIFSQRLGGDPLFYTVILSVGFYLYAAWRQARFATVGLAAALAGLAFVAPDTLTAGLREAPMPWPLLATAALLLTVGIRRRDFWYNLVGSLCLAAALATAIPLPETVFLDLRLGLFVQLVVLALLILGAVYVDRNGWVLRCVGAGGVVILSLLAMHPEKGKGIPDNILTWTQIVYPLVMGILLAVYGRLVRQPFAQVLAVVLLGYWAFQFSRTGYRALRLKVPGLDAIVWGLAFFGVAILVSLAKSKVMARWIEARGGLPGWLRQAMAGPLSPAEAEAVPPPATAEAAEAGNPNRGDLPLSGEGRGAG